MTDIIKEDLEIEISALADLMVEHCRINDQLYIQQKQIAKMAERVNKTLNRYMDVSDKMRERFISLRRIRLEMGEE